MSVSREQALSLLAQANNHGDLAVKLSSLKQARDILACSDPSTVAELLPYLVELQYSPENLVRRSLVEAVEEIVLNAMELSSILMPVLLAFIRDNDPIVARKAIVSGTSIFNSVLEELTLQFHRRGIVERWVEEFWTWMVKFKDAVFGVLWEDVPAGTKLLALKFVETYILLFTSDSHESEKPFTEAILKSGRPFNISWLVGGHPVLDPVALTSEANKSIGILLDLFRSVGSLPGPFAVSVVNCLAAVARKRPLHYNSILSALLDFQPSLERAKGGHMTSIQYSLRSAFLGFLRCTYPAVLESRERLVRVLRGMSAGDAADQAIRQVDKMLKSSERALRDARLTKDDKPPHPLIVAGDIGRKRALPPYGEDLNNSNDVATKRFRVGSNVHPDLPLQMSDVGKDYSANGMPSKDTMLDTGLAIEKMIGVIGALIATGDRATESFDVLVSQIPLDLLADIVITNMRHLPKNPPPRTTLSSLPVTRESESGGPSLASISNGSPASIESPVPAALRTPSSSDVLSMSFPDMYTSANLPADSKRDPRRDPRRLDPRRAAIPSEMPSMANLEDPNNIQSEIATLVPVVTTDESNAVSLMLKKEVDQQVLETPVSIIKDEPGPKEEIVNEAHEISPILEFGAAVDLPLSPIHDYEDPMTRKSADNALTDEIYTSLLLHSEELSPDVSNPTLFEEVSPDLPEIPSYVDLTAEQERTVRNLALERVIESFKRVQTTDCSQTRMSLLARLVAQIDTDEDVIVMMQKHITSDYQLQKGHELVMHILFHLHALMVSDLVEQPSSAALVYEKFFLGVAKFLLDALPATDKSFSRLLSEVPFLSDPGLQLLHKVCCSDYPCPKDGREGDRVTQGLGVVWSLILGRPQSRKACLDIALKCSVHSQDDVRGKAIRLVANKLYVLDYISADIETFATNMLLSAIDHHQVSESQLSQSVAAEQRTDRERGSEETSVSGSFFSEPATSENDSMKGAHSGSQNGFSVLVAEAQRLISLFFALCAKNPRLLELVFKVYGRASKAAKQAIFRHIPTLIRALESSYPELLRIISEPPQGSEHLLTQVLHILAEGTPSPDLIATVKRLYETKLKDATILIPVLSSLSKSEVLPIFPRLVDLPLDKFQEALAHILQGSKNTGPALTPAEVLVAIHDIRPERDGLALKKITDACSACFEQRTVFTQQVLDKALNEMLNQTPLPLLFMRTVIQAIDAFPSLVDCVMDILSKLVNRQIWKMPKLWVGFLKCVSQTQPHSFRVLLQLPQQQLEGALSKYASLRSPLAAYASQPSIRASLPRSTLGVLGLVSEPQMQQQRVTTSLHASEKAAASVHGATLT